MGAAADGRIKLRSGGSGIPLVQRVEDENFRSALIASDPAVQSLTDLMGKDLGFGSHSSAAAAVASPACTTRRSGAGPRGAALFSF